ncbi:MAG: Trm112 family protein [Candidatus Dadabacteria bacterium]|nr:MAG: Trm112 family protein [Candidatus Dadabacteria bacterium]
MNSEKTCVIDEKLLEILACPKCKGELVPADKDILNNLQSSNLKIDGGLLCKACSLLYPIKDDIPILLIDEAINI